MKREYNLEKGGRMYVNGCSIGSGKQVSIQDAEDASHKTLGEMLGEGFIFLPSKVPFCCHWHHA